MQQISAWIMALLCLLGGAALPGAAARGATVPAYLADDARAAFQQWRERPMHRAFALGKRGAWGQAWGHEDVAAARDAARAFCLEHTDRCRVIAENERLLVAADPFPAPDRTEDRREWSWAQDMPDEGIVAFVLLGVALLVAGTAFAERFPLMMSSAHTVHGRPLRINYTAVAAIFAYLMCMMPLFFRTVPDDPGNPGEWFVFGWPFLLPAISVLYLQHRGRLGDGMH